MEENPKTDPFGDGVTEETKKIARDNALKFGLYLGAIGILIGLAVYFFNPFLLFTNLPFIFLIILITIALEVYFCVELRKSLGGFWNFKLAFSSIFIMLLISAVLSIIYQTLLFKVIDKELPEKIRNSTLEMVKKIYSDAGITGDKYDKGIQETNDRLKDLGSPVYLLKNFFMGILVNTILALILAAIFKKEKPIFSTSA